MEQKIYQCYHYFMEILIYHIRKEKRVQMRALAKKTGISKSSLYDYERGRTSPTLEAMEKIAKGLGVKVVDLFKED